MTDVKPAGQRRRQDRYIKERVHDPYKLREKLPEPTVCGTCGAVYHAGRWQWMETPPKGAHEDTCQACHRTQDGYPAGTVTIAGGFAAEHRDEITNLIHDVAATENREHPLHRVMKLEAHGPEMTVETTDIHLPRRIGEALERAFRGVLDFHYEDETYRLRVHWRRDA